MIWTIHFDDSVKKQLQKLDRPVQKKMLNFLDNRLLPLGNPRLLGKALISVSLQQPLSPGKKSPAAR